VACDPNLNLRANLGEPDLEIMAWRYQISMRRWCAQEVLCCGRGGPMSTADCRLPLPATSNRQTLGLGHLDRAHKRMPHWGLQSSK
jgi:hypothetical protein